MPRYVYALDLDDDPEVIREYEAWHRADRVWPEVVESLKSSGLEAIEIFRTGNRLVLIIDAPAGFSPEDKARRDAVNPAVQKWVPMEVIFSLTGGVVRT